MARYDSSRAEEEISLSSDQVEQAIIEYIRDRNFLVDGASSIEIKWVPMRGKPPRAFVHIKRERSK